MAETIDCSVLIPVYNEERHIEQSVAAMRAQDFDGTVEFVFADGGSTDRTRAILERLAVEDSRVVVVDNPGRSVSSGLNVALRVARGRWIVRMDAHTVYPSDYIATGVRRLLRGDTRWVSGPPVPRGHNPGLARGGAGPVDAVRPWRVAQVGPPGRARGRRGAARLGRVRRRVGAHHAARIRRVG